MNYRLIPYMALIISTAVFSIPLPSHGEESPDAEAFTLGEIVVTGKKPGVEAAGAVREVTSADIEASGARTLDEAINLLPGVNIRTGGEGVPRIDIRGFRTRHVVLLLDGVPFNSAFDQQFDPTRIPVENIARIKVTTGPSSVLYGQGGLGGVINIITKKGTRKFSGMVGTEVGDHEPYRAKGSVGGSAGKFDFFLSGSASKTDGFPLSGDFRPTSLQGKGYRGNSDNERNNVYANVGFSPTKDLTFGLTLTYTGGKYGKPASIIAESLDPFASSAKYVRVNDLNGYSVQLAMDYQATDRFSLRSWFFFNQLDQRETQYDDQYMNSWTKANGSYRYDFTSDVIGLSLQPRYDMGKAGVITMGLSVEKDGWDNNGFTTTAPGIFTYDDESKSVNLYSASVEYEVSPLKDLGLVIGYGHHWQNRDERSENGWSLLTSVHYDVARDTRLKAAFQRNIRFPSIRQLYEKPSDNPSLQPERAYLWQVGVERKLPGKSKVGLTGFYTTAKNFIQKDDTTEKNENHSEYRFKGIELSGETNIVPKLLLRASYTYTDSEDTTPGRDEFQYTPAHRVTLEGKYDFNFGLTPYIAFLFTGDQYTYTKNSVTPVRKASMSDFAVVNVKLTQKLLKDRLSVYIGVDNLFDENYETSYGFPQPGRFIFGGLEFRI